VSEIKEYQCVQFNFDLFVYPNELRLQNIWDFYFSGSLAIPFTENYSSM